MKSTAGMLFAAFLVVLAVGPGLTAIAAEEGVAVQDLTSPMASGKVTAAFWSRQTDAYSLNLMVPQFIGNTIACLRGLDPTFGTRTLTKQEGRMQETPPTNPVPPASADKLSQPGIVNVAEALQGLVPQIISTYQPVVVTTAADFGGTIQRQPKVVQVWLLRADGTQILPVSRSDDFARKKTCAEIEAAFKARTGSSKLAYARRFDNEILYRYSVVDSEQAVAAAIRIDDEYYIEKLQPLKLPQPGQ